MKSNKSARSRIRVTKKGTLLASGKGRGHFNAKHSRSKKLTQKRQRAVPVPTKMRQRYTLSSS